MTHVAQPIDAALQLWEIGEARGMTRGQFARAVGVSPQNVSSILVGSRACTWTMLHRWLDAWEAGVGPVQLTVSRGEVQVVAVD